MSEHENKKNAEMNDSEKKIILNWAKKYMELTIDQNTPENKSQQIKQCYIAHYNENNMDLLLKNFIGRIEEFLKFLEKEGGWIIDYDRKNGIITADENKDYCVCPLVKYKIFDHEQLCNCSEGYTEKMFSTVLERKVKTYVTRSYLRDKQSCIYKIEIS